MQNKAIERNVIAAGALVASSTTTSAIHTNTWGKGIRFYVTVASGANSGGLESLSLCALPPAAVEASANVVPLFGFSGAGLLTGVTGTCCFDFYPGNWMPAGGVVPGGALLGAAGICLPLKWAVRIVLPAGSSGTFTVDAEILP